MRGIRIYTKGKKQLLTKAIKHATDASRFHSQNVIFHQKDKRGKSLKMK